MVHVKAPTLVPAAPLDLVVVLDVRESMAGAKLAQVKRAMGFVIDRLSVVAFSGDARRVTRLTRMTAEGKAAAKRAVEAFQESGASTNVRAGLDEAAKVLGGCLHWNDVAAVILVSDGHDSCVVPEFFYSLNSVRPTPVHIVRCIAGLLSVSAKDSKVEIECSINPVNDDVIDVTAVKSGRYKNGLDRPYDQTWVYVGDLYADEERRILQPVDVELADVDIYVEIERPVEVKPTDMARCKEVERQLLRVAAAEDMELAREAAERGAHAEAARILDTRRESLSRSAVALSGDAMCTALVAELHELSRRVSGEREYRKTGRACFLASMSSHALQRGSSSVRFGCVDGIRDPGNAEDGEVVGYDA
ncbi:probable E3 ubiquitin-protein ligase EDA40 [Miscanthus floridulus]|uniref:probable E3 ubiquitin-protein ligase EDA40 n=1 Tax=Miscanthus floridulus TaxID=154761 RepID=UPI0034585CC3